MNPVNVHEAKSNLSRLLDQVEAGEEIVIARAGRPVAKLVGLETNLKPRRPGALKGRIHVPDDFDAPLPEGVLDAFEGRRP